MASKSKLETTIKELARIPTNKPCFDCGRPGPQGNVNLSMNTFVCTTCAGLHRQFSHKVKTINMSSFTEAEVEGLQNGGNIKAAKYWFGNWVDGAFKLDQDDPKSIEQFMRMVYQHRKWVKEESAAAVAAPEEKKEKKKKIKAAVEAVKLAGPAGSMKVASADSAGSNSFNPQFPSAAAAVPAVVGFDFLSNMTSLSFEENHAPAAAKPVAAAHQPSFASGFEDSPFPHESDSFEAKFPDHNSHAQTNGVSHASSSATAVSTLAAHFRAVQSQFGLDSNGLQQAIQQALQSLRSPVESVKAPAAAQPAAAPVQQQAKTDFFADLPVANGETGGDDDDGNPFGSDSDDDNVQVRPQAMQLQQQQNQQNRIPQQQQHQQHQQQQQQQLQYNQMALQQQQQQPQQAAFFAAPNGFPGAAFPQVANGQAAYFPAVQMQVHPAQFAAQTAFMQQQHLVQAQQAARDQAQFQQQQQQRAATDSSLFSVLNPLSL